MRSLLTLLLLATGCLGATRITPARTTAVTRPTVEQKCQRLAERWRQRFEAEGVECVVSPPFVVAGDGGRQRLNRYVDHTICASAAALHRQFFDRARPNEPVLILLFESAESY